MNGSTWEESAETRRDEWVGSNAERGGEHVAFAVGVVQVVRKKKISNDDRRTAWGGKSLKSNLYGEN